MRELTTSEIEEVSGAGIFDRAVREAVGKIGGRRRRRTSIAEIARRLAGRVRGGAKGWKRR